MRGYPETDFVFWARDPPPPTPPKQIKSQGNGQERFSGKPPVKIKKNSKFQYVMKPKDTEVTSFKPDLLQAWYVK